MRRMRISCATHFIVEEKHGTEHRKREQGVRQGQMGVTGFQFDADAGRVGAARSERGGQVFAHAHTGDDYASDAGDGDVERAGHCQGTECTARGYEYLGFMDELKLMTDDDNWEKFQGALEPKDSFWNLMNEVRVTRKQLAHFRRRPDTVQYDGVRTAIDWLETRPKLVMPEVAEKQDATKEKGG